MKKSLFLIPLFLTIILLLPLTDCTHSSSGESCDDGVIRYTIPEAAEYISELTGNETYTIIIEDSFTKSCEALYEALLGLTFEGEEYRKENYEGPYIILDLSKATALEIGDNALQGIPIDAEYVYGYALKEVILPENCTSIGNRAFEAQASLEKVTFPKSLKIIDQYAFAHCTSLKEVDLTPCTKLEEVCDCAFYYCSSLEKVDMSKCKVLCYIGQNAFHKSDSITVITIYSANDGKAWGHGEYNTDENIKDCLEHFINPTEDDVTIVPCFAENTLWFLTKSTDLEVELVCTGGECCEGNGCDCQTLKRTGYDYHWYKVAIE